MNLNNAHEGYDYQDLLTSYFILKEILLGNNNAIFSIEKKHTTSNIPDRFDDLVIKNDMSIQRKQIKYSNDTTRKKLKKEDLLERLLENSIKTFSLNPSYVLDKNNEIEHPIFKLFNFSKKNNEISRSHDEKNK
jgi:hypothetical protein